MSIVIHFERSEACAEAHGAAAERKTVPYDTTDGSWVQLTCDCLRAQDGAFLANIDKCGCWEYNGEHFSDIIIEFQGDQP